MRNFDEQLWGFRRAVSREHIDAPNVHTSPRLELGGVTGLGTWFWHEGPEEIVAEASIRGYAVSANMRPTRFSWDPCGDFKPTSDDAPRQAVGCPTLLESTTPGSEPAPNSDGSAAARHWTYETKGYYTIRHQVVWDGTWAFTGHGASASGFLPSIRAVGEAGYKVDEIRSVTYEGR